MIPESISALVWQMQHKWLWTVGMVVSAIGMMALMMEASERLPNSDLLGVVAFACCACVAFVGAMPLFNKETCKAHYVLATIGAVLSQLWCLMVVWHDQCTLMLYLGWWILAAMLMRDFQKYWCLIAEVFAIVSVTWICINIIV